MRGFFNAENDLLEPLYIVFANGSQVFGKEVEVWFLVT